MYVLILISVLCSPVLAAASDSADDTYAADTGILETDGLKAEDINEELFSTDKFAVLKYNVEVYNRNVDNLPPHIAIFKMLVKDEDILLVMTQDDGSELYIRAVEEDCKVVVFEKIEDPEGLEPTVTCRTDKETLREIYHSPKPFKALAKALKDGSIETEHAGIYEKIGIKILKSSWVIDFFKDAGFCIPGLNVK
ncbi:hypothetical protein [Methanosarcina sp. MTP4]|uniref:hypothetical protein n=1 Tax=Methanosarcina sp. MTP4 TaxID=1434100 RepID=UPI0018CD07A6|nr:hypothetical protein [Methanosarcina sp. MTP4]